MTEARAKGTPPLTQESFDLLLSWLASDRDQAGQKYEDIRRELVKVFTCRGCVEADQLADETIDRVCKKLPEVVSTFEGNPALYFYGIARNLLHEYSRKKPDPVPPSPLPPDENDEQEREYNCLDACLQQLAPGNRELVLEYYQEEKRAKTVRRSELARRLGIEPSALRGRAYRIRQNLQQCVLECLVRGSG